MNIYGQLVKAKLEQSTDDVPFTSKGLVWFNSTVKRFKYHDGDAVRELVDTATTQTLTGKTITGNTAANIKPSASNLLTLPDVTDTLVARNTTDTLTNKTLTTPVIGQIKPDGTHTLTLPVVTDNLLSRTSTDTITNKTIVAANNTITTVAAGQITANELNAVISQINTLLTANQVAPTGTVVAYKGSSAPTGWLMCNGAAVSRTTYSSLFALLGTSEGAGDGSTTFNTPDLRGYFIRGKMDIGSNSGSGTVSSNNATFFSHGINRTGFKVRITSGTLTGLTLNTDYYAIVIDANTIAFALTYADAVAGIKIAISGTNSASLTQYEDPDKNTRVGDRQEDQLKSHNHGMSSAFGMNFHQGSGDYQTSQIGTPTWTGNIAQGGDSVAVVGSASGGMQIGGTTDGVTNLTTAENRPKNIALNYIIKV